MKSWDVIVIGSGAAGFAAAVTACCKGLSVLMLEKAGQFGGTSAISGGAVWLHDTDQARAEGKSGSAEAMKTYLRTIIGEGQYREDLAEAFVSAGREALAFLEREGAVKYSLRPLSPDYYPDEPGAVDVGRALEVVEYDGRELGDAFRDLRSPPPGMLLFGGMMVNRVDIQHFLDMRRSLRSLAHCTRLLLRYARDRVKYPRGTRLAMGNALIARMATTALRKGMNLRLNVNVLALCEAQGAVHGVEIEYQGQRETLHARRGVVLAAGGFAAGALAARYRPHTREHFTMSPPANDGAALRLAAALNAREGADRPSNFFLGAGIGADPGRRQRGALPPSGNRSRKTGRDCRQSAGGTLRQRVQLLSPFRQRNAGCSGKCPLFFTLRRPGDEALWPRAGTPGAGQ